MSSDKYRMRFKQFLSESNSPIKDGEPFLVVSDMLAVCYDFDDETGEMSKPTYLYAGTVGSVKEKVTDSILRLETRGRFYYIGVSAYLVKDNIFRGTKKDYDRKFLDGLKEANSSITGNWYPTLDLKQGDGIVFLNDTVVYHDFDPETESFDDYASVFGGEEGIFQKQHGPAVEILLNGLTYFARAKAFVAVNNVPAKIMKGDRSDYHRYFFNELKEDGPFTIGAEKILTAPLVGKGYGKRRFEKGSTVKMTSDNGVDILFTVNGGTQTWKCSKADWKKAIKPLSENFEKEQIRFVIRTFPVFRVRFGSTYAAATLNNLIPKAKDPASLLSYVNIFAYYGEAVAEEHREYAKIPKDEFILLRLFSDRQRLTESVCVAARRSDFEQFTATKQELDRKFLDNLVDE